MICLSMCLAAQSCLFATSWTVAGQAPLSMGFSRQEYWSGLPFPSPLFVWGFYKILTSPAKLKIRYAEKFGPKHTVFNHNLFKNFSICVGKTQLHFSCSFHWDGIFCTFKNLWPHLKCSWLQSLASFAYCHQAYPELVFLQLLKYKTIRKIDFSHSLGFWG